jgi:hypothetical protein
LREETEAELKAIEKGNLAVKKGTNSWGKVKWI